MVVVALDQSTSCPEWVTGHILLIPLQQRPLFGFLVNPFGTTARAIQLEGDHLLVTRRGTPASVSLADIGEASGVIPPFLALGDAHIVRFGFRGALDGLSVA